MTKVKSTQPKHHLYFWGHLAKGLIYVIVGGIALATVFGRASDPKGPERIATYLQDEWLGQILLGILAVGFLIIAYFLVRAVIQQDPTEYRGIGGVLSYLHQGIGVYLVALIGLGLLLYGSFVLVKANYRDLA